MPRLGEERALVGTLDDPAEVHHGDPGRDVAHDREIVGDEEVRETEALLQVREQVDHLRLDRDVERRHRLVADDEPRLDRESPGDADPLALTAGELVRIAPRVSRRESDLLQHLRHPRLPVPFGKAVQRERLGERLSDRHSRIERGERILENDLQRPPVLPHFVFRQRGQFDSVEPHLAERRFEKPQHEPPGGRLPAAGFADQGQRVAGREIEIDAVHRAHDTRRAPEEPAPHGKVLDQALDPQQRCGRNGRGHLRTSEPSSGARQQATR